MALSEILTIMDIRNKETRESLKIDWPVFISRFNATLRHYGSAIPELKYLSKGKKVQAQRIVNEAGTQQILIDAVVNMAKSDLCNGRVKTKDFPNGWVASFFWLLKKDEHVYELANDKFKNPDPTELTADEQRQLEQERYRAQEAARRAENRAIEEQIRAEERQRRERQQKEWERNKPTEADLKRILGNNWLLD